MKAAFKLAILQLLNSTLALNTSDIRYNLTGDEQTDKELDFGRGSSDYSYDHLKDIDTVAANGIHPNNHRKVRVPAYYVFFPCNI